MYVCNINVIKLLKPLPAHCDPSVLRAQRTASAAGASLLLSKVLHVIYATYVYYASALILNCLVVRYVATASAACELQRVTFKTVCSLKRTCFAYSSCTRNAFMTHSSHNHGVLVAYSPHACRILVAYSLHTRNMLVAH